jgi:hypothetical protein
VLSIVPIPALGYDGAMTPGGSAVRPLLGLAGGSMAEFELALGEGPLTVLGVTMPSWPGADEATAAAGPWTPTV